jgi:hypothetical protein
MNEIKSWFFEKVNKIDRLDKMRRGRKQTQISKIRYSKG